MKKKIWIIIVIAVAIVFLVGGLTTLLYASNGRKIRQRGSTTFGTTYCHENHHTSGGGDAFTNWTCALCGREGTCPGTDVPTICDNCARTARRCRHCGRLER